MFSSSRPRVGDREQLSKHQIGKKRKRKKRSPRRQKVHNRTFPPCDFTMASGVIRGGHRPNCHPSNVGMANDITG